MATWLVPSAIWPRRCNRAAVRVLRARCLCYLNVRGLRCHDIEAVRSRAPEVLAAAEAAQYPEYVVAAKATLAWVAWRDERSEDVLALAAEALELWRTTVVSYSWYWLCLWPLTAVHLEGGRTAEAVAASRQLLAPPQQRLPDELERLVQSVGELWDEARRNGRRRSSAGRSAWRPSCATPSARATRRRLPGGKVSGRRPLEACSVANKGDRSKAKERGSK